MLNFLCFSVKNCIDVVYHLKAFMIMFIIYYENMWYDLDQI